MSLQHPRRSLATRPEFTPHVHIDLEGALAGDAIDINGHLFLAHDSRFDASGKVTSSLHGAVSVTQRLASLELKLVHADWAGCPAVDPAPSASRDPAAAEPWSVWSVQPGGRLFVFHSGLRRFLPVVADLSEALDADAMTALGARPVSND